MKIIKYLLAPYRKRKIINKIIKRCKDKIPKYSSCGKKLLIELEFKYNIFYDIYTKKPHRWFGVYICGYYENGFYKRPEFYIPRNGIIFLIH
jgi:hypothetical protein